MGTAKVKRHILSFVTSFIILIPLIAMTAFASSIESFGFVFNGSSGTDFSEFELKDDVKANTPASLSAGVTINTREYGAGSVSLWIQHEDCVTRATYNVSGINGNTPNPVTLYYIPKNLPNEETCLVRLCCIANSTVQAIAGVWQP